MALEFFLVAMETRSTMLSSSWATLRVIGFAKTNGDQISELAAISTSREITTETVESEHLCM